MLEGGKEFIHYDKLILAPGSQPRKLPIPGVDLENVFTFRGIDDSIKVEAGEVPPDGLCLTVNIHGLPSRQGR